MSEDKALTKEEFAEKWGKQPTISCDGEPRVFDMTIICLSDLNALLREEMRKEIRQELIAYDEWKHPARPRLIIEDKVDEYLRSQQQ
jgi:hypothetical protein